MSYGQNLGLGGTYRGYIYMGVKGDLFKGYTTNLVQGVM